MDKITKVHNTSTVPMVLRSKNKYMILKSWRIEAGKYIYLPYRDGMASWGGLVEVSYEVYPADRDDGWLVRGTFLPIHVHDNSEIKILFDTAIRGMVDFHFVPETGFLQRMRFPRWVKDKFFG